MTTDFQNILEDLYALDPSLREQERELIPILQQLLKAKPDVDPDPAFVQKLRMLLREKTVESPARSSSILSFFSMPKFSYALSGAVVGVVLAVPAVYIALNQDAIPSIPLNEDAQPALFSYNVTDAGPQAFGDLSTQNMNIAGAPAGLGGATGRGGGGGDAAMTAESAPAPVGKMIAPDMILPAEITEYTFTVEGELPALDQESVDVFKRQKGTSSADARSVLNLTNIGLVDLSSFDSSKVDSVNFFQDKPFGHIYNIVFREGSISIYQNWERWPHPEQNCQSEDCFARYRLKPGDLPADDVLIDVANAFAEEHDIDLSRYGEPIVDKSWKRYYDTMPEREKTMFSIGEAINVIYPFLMEGKPVLDESGNPHGISIGVNIREKKVQEAWGIMDRSYLKSAYPGVTDASDITRFLEESGKYPPNVYQQGAERKQVEITLGVPTAGNVLVHSFEQNRNEELIVPALIFPVTNVPEGANYHRSTVTIPLAKDILEKMLNREMDFRAL